MSIDRRKGGYFEAVADDYAGARRGYPEALVTDLLALARVPAGGRLLEIGCGPGNATLAYARRGYRILALEPGPRLAALAAHICRPYPLVQVQTVAFEDWPLAEQAFDLVLAADALHWIPPEVAYPKAAAALKEGGAAAFYWHVPVDPETDWSRQVADVYRRLAPAVGYPDTTVTVDWLTGIISENFRASGAFGPVTVRAYRWSETYTTAQYRQLLRTYAMHHDLDPGTRDRLLDAIAAVVEAHGGQVTEPRLALLFHAPVQR